MINTIASFLNTMYNSDFFAPLFDFLSSKLVVPKWVVVYHATQGFRENAIPFTIVAALIAAALILLILWLFKRAGKLTTTKKIVTIVLVVILAVAGDLAACGAKYAINILGLNNPSNAAKYTAENATEVLEDSPIKGKTILWLGSSVTEGFAAKHESMADFITYRNSTNMIKDCYSGSSIATTSDNDFLPRLLKHDKTTDPVVDLVVIQLSTNDANKNRKAEVGDITALDMLDKDQLDINTTIGAMEYIMAYCKETWNCPVLIYTNLQFAAGANQDGTVYQDIIDKCEIACQKWGGTILDFFNDTDMNKLVTEDPALYKIYMNDSVHPTKRGYLEWWTPIFEKAIYSIIGENVQA